MLGSAGPRAYGSALLLLAATTAWLLTSAIPLTAAPAGAASPSAGPASSAAAKKPDPKSFETLLKQGHDALAAGEYKAARDAFLDASTIDSHHVAALHGLGVAYMYLNDFHHAREPMEKALNLNASAPNRALVLNMAVCQIGAKNPMRAAKIIMEYLLAHPKELDEPMLNAMGTALTIADDQAKKGKMFQDCVTFFVIYNQKLEATRSGLKRWGVQWMKAEVVDSRNAENISIGKQLAVLDRALSELDVKITRDERALEKTRDLCRRGFRDQSDVQREEAALKIPTDDQRKKQKEYEDLASRIRQPFFPKAMTLVAMDASKPPPVAENVTLAQGNESAAASVESIATPRRFGNRPKASDGGAADTGVGAKNAPVAVDTKPKPAAADPKLPEDPPISVAAQAGARRKTLIHSYAAAFPIGPDLVVTASAPLAGATDIGVQTADGTPMEASLVRADERSGLALLRVAGAKFIPLPLASAYTGGPLQCASYPTVNIFNPQAESIPGTGKPVAAGEWRIALVRHPRLGGAPLFVQGKLVGVELAARDTDSREIPSATLEQIKSFLGPDAPAAQIGPDPCAVLLQLMATRETSGE